MAAEARPLREILDAALRLSAEEQRELAESLLQRLQPDESGEPERTRLAELMWGTIGNVDRQTLIQLAEDEEYGAY